MSTSKSRTIHLQQDFKEIKIIEQNVKAIQLNSIYDKYLPTKYEIQVDIRSIIGVNKGDKPIFANQFIIYIQLSKQYPENAAPICTIRPCPFHPYFKKKKIQDLGEWRDEKPHNSKTHLGDLLLRVVSFLQFKTIPKKYYSVNSTAWNWCEKHKDNSPPLFPTDCTTIPRALKEIPNQFKINVHDSGPIKTKDGDQLPTTNTVGDCLIKKRKFNVDTASSIAISLPPATPSTTKKFNVVKTTEVYKPLEEIRPWFQICNSANFHGHCKTHELYIEQRASQIIFEHIGWGNRTNQNVVEQGGLLLGQVYKDIRRKIIWGNVMEVVPGKTAKGSGAYLEMNHHTWKTMIDQVDEMVDSCENNKLQIIGWYHTHPNSLSVFMSGTDRATQVKMFSNDWQFALVLNPHQKKWCVFHGINADECAGHIVAEESEDKLMEHTYPTGKNNSHDVVEMRENSLYDENEDERCCNNLSVCAETLQENDQSKAKRLKKERFLSIILFVAVLFVAVLLSAILSAA